MRSGEGTFGVVSKARDKVVSSLVRARTPAPLSALTVARLRQTNEWVAIKRVWLGKYKEVRSSRRARALPSPAPLLANCSHPGRERDCAA